MKKLIAIFLTLFALVAHSGQTVPIVWPFNPSVMLANYLRAIIDEANRQQDKYTFVFENKIGAGGTVAAQYVLNHPGPILLYNGTSFFTRPFFYPNESYKAQDFKPVYVLCTGQPYGIVSTKFENIEQVRQQKSVTIGGLNGSLTETMIRQFALLLPNTELIFVPFQATSVATLEMVSGRLDLNVDLPANITGDKWAGRAKINVVGSGGTHKHSDFRSFASQGIRGFDGLVNNQFIAAPQSLGTEQTEELYGILSKAAKNNQRLLKMYESDYCEAANMDWQTTNRTFETWQKYWPEKLQSLKK